MRAATHRLLFVVVVLTLLAACGRGGPAPRSTPGGAGATDAVERFLRLAAAREYVEMGWVFGTRQGPVMQRDPAPEVERRMFAIAQVLEYQRFAIQGESSVPGSVGSAVRVDVRLHNRGRDYVVPFTAVRGPRDRWYVEEVALTAITGAR